MHRARYVGRDVGVPFSQHTTLPKSLNVQSESSTNSVLLGFYGGSITGMIDKIIDHR